MSFSTQLCTTAPDPPTDRTAKRASDGFESDVAGRKTGTLGMSLCNLKTHAEFSFYKEPCTHFCTPFFTIHVMHKKQPTVTIAGNLQVCIQGLQSYKPTPLSLQPIL